MKHLSLFAASGLVLTLPLGAATIVDFDFSGVNGTIAHAADFEITATTTMESNLSVVTGVSHLAPSVVEYATAGAATTNDFNLDHFGGATIFSSAVAGDRYISFIIKADAGFALNLDGATMSWDLRRNGTGAADVYGFAANAGSGLVQIGTNATVGVNATPTTVSRTFSGSEWDGLTGDVEIFLYGFSATNSDGGNTHFSDATITNGTVTAVPEPSSAALIGLGGLALILRRRK